MLNFLKSYKKKLTIISVVLKWSSFQVIIFFFEKITNYFRIRDFRPCFRQFSFRFDKCFFLFGKVFHWLTF